MKMILTDNRRVRLWHPDSPGEHVWVDACWLRRIGLIRSPFATIGETLNSMQRGDRSWDLT